MKHVLWRPEGGKEVSHKIDEDWAKGNSHLPRDWDSAARVFVLTSYATCFLIFGWLVGMRRSILMLGSTLALFLYHAKWSPGHFGSRSSPLLFKSSWSPLGPGNMAQWGQQAQQGDRRGWGSRDRGDRDQWTGGRSGGGGGGYGAHNPYEVQPPSSSPRSSLLMTKTGHPS